LTLGTIKNQIKKIKKKIEKKEEEEEGWLSHPLG
jgi:hypothetical protein